MDDKEIVSALLSKLADKVGKDRYETWFAGGTRLSWQAGRLTVHAPNLFVQDSLRKIFREDLRTLCAELTGAEVEVGFEVDSNPVVEESGPSLSQPECAVPQQSTESVPGTLRLSHAAGQQKKSPQKASSAKGPESTSLPLRLVATSGRQLPTFAHFVEGDSNRMALHSAKLILEEPGQMSPLTLYGAAGLGKTHLLEALLFAARERRRNAIYLPAEQFASLYIEACKGKGVPSFRQKYRNVDLLLIDDIHFFARTKGTVVELLHTMDTLQRAGKQLVFAADRAPGEITELGPEVVGRLKAGLHCELKLPDFATRLGIVRELCRRMEMELPAGIDLQIALQITGTARELMGALNRLDATSRALGLPLTIEMAEQALSELCRQTTKPVQLRDIQHVVCDLFGLTPESLLSNRRGDDVQQPRMLAMFLARKHTRAALGEISRYFGRRSHSTVITANKTVESWMSNGHMLHLARQSCDIEQAIRRIEEQLRAV